VGQQLAGSHEARSGARRGHRRARRPKHHRIQHSAAAEQRPSVAPDRDWRVRSCKTAGERGFESGVTVSQCHVVSITAGVIGCPGMSQNDKSAVAQPAAGYRIRLLSDAPAEADEFEAGGPHRRSSTRTSVRSTSRLRSSTVCTCTTCATRRSRSCARAGYRPEWVAERAGHNDGGALILRKLPPSLPERNEHRRSKPGCAARGCERVTGFGRAKCGPTVESFGVGEGRGRSTAGLAVCRYQAKGRR
jgi:hypothetical protein